MNKRFPIFIGFLLLALALWLHITTVHSVRYWMSRLNNLTYDIQLRAQILVQGSPSLKTSVAIVDIDNQSLQAVGHWPWSREIIAKLTHQIQAQGAVVIAFDMTFTRPDTNMVDTVIKQLSLQNLMTPSMEGGLKQIRPFFDDDAKFLVSLKQGDCVLGLAFLLNPVTEGVLPAPDLMLTSQGKKDLDFYVMTGVLGVNPAFTVAHAGFINIFPDEDGVIRRVPLLLNYKDGLYPSLALEAVKVYLFQKIQLVTNYYGDTLRLEGVKLGNELIPTDEKSQVIIPFRGLGHTFPYFSAVDVLNNKIPTDAFTGKIVFVGTTAVGLNDSKPTAIQSLFPGVEINATIADGLLKNNFPTKPVWALGAEALFTLILGIILILLFPYLGPLILTLFIFLIPLLLIFLDNWVIKKTGFIFADVIPIIFTFMLALINIMYGFLFESRHRERLKAIFGQYVPEKHIDEMLNYRGTFALRGEDREMTVLFADIRNFTTLSEGMPASQLKELLNAFFTPMTEIIFKQSGTIDKYVGDLIMAFWGAPLIDAKHAEHALSAALDMQKEVTRLKLVLTEWPEINIGIGINTGMMSVGDMGSKFRRNYTVLGDAVNLASRAESLTKHYGVTILTTEFTKQNQTKFVFRLLDRVRVQGKQNSVVLYEVVCYSSELTDALHQEIELSDAALNLYFQQQWESAKAAFEALHEAHPAVKIYALYIKRIAEFIKTPPPKDWDGVYTHLYK